MTYVWYVIIAVVVLAIEVGQISIMLSLALKVSVLEDTNEGLLKQLEPKVRSFP